MLLLLRSRIFADIYHTFPKWIGMSAAAGGGIFGKECLMEETDCDVCFPLMRIIWVIFMTTLDSIMSLHDKLNPHCDGNDVLMAISYLQSTLLWIFFSPILFYTRLSWLSSIWLRAMGNVPLLQFRCVACQQLCSKIWEHTDLQFLPNRRRPNKNIASTTVLKLIFQNIINLHRYKW